MRPLRASVVGCAVVAGTVAVAGCGDGEQERAAPAAPPQTAAAPAGRPVETLDVTETEYKIDPADPEIPKSGVVELNVANDGSVDHSLEVEGPGGESVTPTLAPGDSTTLKVDLPPGEYTWYCPIANHRELGMEGTVTVAGNSGGDGGDGRGTGAGAGDSEGSGSGGESSGGAGY